MKVSFVANFMNHHQLPFSQKMIELCDGNYFFVACTPLPDERKNSGYMNMNDMPFVLKLYGNKLEKNEAINHILTDDYVIFGSCPNYLVEMRKNTGKPFIFYSERFFKKGTYRRFVPITYHKIYERMLKYEKCNTSVLCSSAYLPYDLFLLKKNFKTYKWGYFPEFQKKDVDEIIAKKIPASIIWVGRLIRLKHPEYCIFLARYLKKVGLDFRITIIGDGELKNDLLRLIKKYELEKYIKMMGAIDSTKVRNYMDSSEIFIFNSDKHEGWGAVVNEAMNSACAIVSSSSPGSIPFLIQNGVNGLTYKSNDKKSFVKNVYDLLIDKEKRCFLSKNAYLTIETEWNSNVATERLFNLMKLGLIGKDVSYYSSGPCSCANIIKG